MALRWPRIERDGRIGTMAAHADCVETMRIAVEEMAGILRERLQLSRADALMLLSVRGDVQICTCHNHPRRAHDAGDVPEALGRLTPPERSRAGFAKR